MPGQGAHKLHLDTSVIHDNNDSNKANNGVSGGRNISGDEFSEVAEGSNHSLLLSDQSIGFDQNFTALNKVGNASEDAEFTFDISDTSEYYGLGSPSSHTNVRDPNPVRKGLSIDIVAAHTAASNVDGAKSSSRISNGPQSGRSNRSAYSTTSQATVSTVESQGSVIRSKPAARKKTDRYRKSRIEREQEYINILPGAIMAEFPLKSLLRCFSKYGVSKTRNMNEYELRVAYREWRAMEAQQRKDLRAYKRDLANGITTTYSNTGTNINHTTKKRRRRTANASNAIHSNDDEYCNYNSTYLKVIGTVWKLII